MKPFLGRLSAFVLTATLGLSGAAMAQSGHKPAAGENPDAASRPQGPVKLELQASQKAWTKICGPGNTRQVCYTTRDFGQGPNTPPTLALAVYQMPQDKRIARFLLPVALLLKPGFRLIIDKGEPIPGQFAVCFPNGCFAETELTGATLNALKKAQTISVEVRNQVNNEVTFVVPMKDFAAAFDGPPIDPKVLKEQNEALQKQLEERAKTEREELEKQQSGAAAAPAAPATPAK